MIESIAHFVENGLLSPSWLTLLITFFVFTQLTIFSVTLYLHRCMAHRGVDLHPLVAHVFRFWCWATTAMVTREWVAIHRKHHAFCETENDPHSPQIHGIRKVLWDGVDLYRKARRDEATMEKYGAGCPEDFIERNVYARYPALGPTLLLFAMIAAFGAWGLVLWAGQMIWIPFFAAGVVNGLGHWWGYRNFETQDAATNLVPWGVWIGGEELHNNHHAFPSSAKFALKPGEFDIGWAALLLMQKLGLAKIRRVAPMLERTEPKREIDIEAMRAILAHRFQVMSDYYRGVVLPVVQEEARQAGESIRRWRRNAQRLLRSEGRWLKPNAEQTMREWLNQRPLLATVCEYRARLRAVWERSHPNNESLISALQEWCREAEASGIRALQDFAATLRSYRLRNHPAAA